jgi:glycosyltransferase involved in cell wall biosynthesis
MKLAVVIPIFNELENLPSLIDSVEQLGNSTTEITIIVCDDGSNDGSRLWLDEEQQKGRLIVLGDGNNYGPGVAFENGFQYVLKTHPDFDFLITMEGDETADLTSLQSMFDSISLADVVLASVYLEGGGFSKTNWARLLISKFANGLTRLCLNLPFQTLTSFYRIYRVSTLHQLHQNSNQIFSEKGFICQVEILYKLHRKGFVIKEIPTTLFTDRRKGKSKMKLGKTMIAHIRFLWRTVLHAK